MSTTANNPRVEAIRRNVRSSYEALNSLIESHLAEIEPALLYQAPAQGEWTVMENLAHIAEFMPYWADQIAALVASPGRNFGRTQADAKRLNALGVHGHDSLDQVRAALPPAYMYLDRALSALTDSDLELTGQHPRFGERTLDWFIGESVTDHLANHVEQMKKSLAELGQ